MILVFTITVFGNLFAAPEIKVKSVPTWYYADLVARVCEKKTGCYPLVVEIKDEKTLRVYRRESEKVWKPDSAPTKAKEAGK